MMRSIVVLYFIGLFSLSEVVVGYLTGGPTEASSKAPSTPKHPPKYPIALNEARTAPTQTSDPLAWVVTLLPNGYFTIQSASTGLFLNGYDSNPQYTALDHGYTLWVIGSSDPGYYYLQVIGLRDPDFYYTPGEGGFLDGRGPTDSQPLVSYDFYRGINEIYFQWNIFTACSATNNELPAGTVYLQSKSSGKFLDNRSPTLLSATPNCASPPTLKPTQHHRTHLRPSTSSV